MTDESPIHPADTSPAAAESRDAAEAGAVDAAALTRERDDLYDRLLRKTAEFENYRRRIERERREQSDQAVVDLLQQLLSVVDDFDRALTVEAGPEANAYRKGVELIHAKMNDVLRRYNVRPFETVGMDFDPNLHQAVVHETSPDHREGEVIGELQRGYLMGDKLLRPAMVKVAKA
ncbi:MAG TPA: nucleotide exchange factor GrpE [Vicinamibacterales bacterium]|jgi:molecular chaperone GrpE|nr:nucleotide exchange factor GrpE [Vicinamibacterales bacterium]